MTKELEALEKLDNTLCINNIRGNIEFGIATEELIDCNSVIDMIEYLEVVGSALKELQAIKEAKPSEAFKCVDVLKEDGCITTLVQGKALETIRQYILKAEKLEKAWEVVKEKSVNVLILKDSFIYENGLEYYNKEWHWKYLALTQEEYDLLKEVLE